jgi:hypothetical protein
VAERCRKATVRVKERCNQVTLRVQPVPIGALGRGLELGGLGSDGRVARVAARSALGAPNHGRHRNRLRGAPRIMFGMPFWPGTAHIVPLRPIGVEQGLGHSVQEVGEVGGERRSLAASSEYPNRGPCRNHDACPLGSLSFRLLHSLVGQRAKRSGSIDGRPVALNLGKTSYLRSYAIRRLSCVRDTSIASRRM